MKTNVGTADKIIRILIALGFGALFISQTATGIWGYTLLALGGVLIVTAMVGFCPLYRLLGISTCRLK